MLGVCENRTFPMLEKTASNMDAVTHRRYRLRIAAEFFCVVGKFMIWFSMEIQTRVVGACAISRIAHVDSHT